jgi:uncharacterized protein
VILGAATFAQKVTFFESQACYLKHYKISVVKNKTNQLIINTADFTLSKELVSGVVAGLDLERAADMLHEKTARVDWALRGEQNQRVDGGVEQYLGLTLKGSAHMVCLRCLGMVVIPIAEDRQFRLAKDEVDAEKLDLEDDWIDAIVGGSRFDVLSLVEDEVILALPFSPMHESCESPIGKDVADERPNPFLVLAQMKKPNP